MISLVTSGLSPAAQSLVSPVLSLDPPESALRLIQMIGACALFVVIAYYSQERSRRKLIFRSFLAGSFCLYAIAVIHAVLAIKIWDQYDANATPFFAPIKNGNHLSHLFGLYAFLCLAGAVHTKHKFESYVFAIAAILMASGVFLTLSRGGILAFIFTGAITFTWQLWISWKKGKPALKGGLALQVGLAAFFITACTVAAAFYIAGSQISTEMMSLQEQIKHADKSELYGPSISLLNDHWRVGIGANALYSLFFTSLSNAPHTPFLLSGQVNLPFVENTFIQTFVDHGLIKGTLLYLVCLLIMVSIVRKVYRSIVLLLLFSGIIFIFAGDITDFSLEGGGILWLVTATMSLISGTLLSLQKRSKVDPPEHNNTKYPQHASVLNTLPLLATLLVLGSGMVYFAPSAVSNHAAYQHDIFDAGEKSNAELVEAFVAQHPLNSELLLKLGIAKVARKEYVSAEHWAELTTRIRPTDSRGYLLLAQTQLQQQKFDDALRSIKQAWTANPGQSDTLLQVISSLEPEADALFEYLPAKNGVYLMGLCRYFHQKEKLEQVHTCLSMLENDKTLKDPQIQQALAWSIARKHIKLAESFQTRVAGKNPGDDIVNRADIELLTHDFSETIFKKQVSLLGEVATPCQMISWLIHKTRDHNMLDDCWEMVKLSQQHSCLSAIADLELTIDLNQRSGHTGAALEGLDQLITLAGENTGLLVRKTQLQLHTGQVLQAEKTIQSAARLDNNDSVKALVEEIKARKLTLLSQLKRPF